MERSEGGRKGHEWRYCPKKDCKRTGASVDGAADTFLYRRRLLRRRSGSKPQWPRRKECKGGTFPLRKKKYLSSFNALLPVQVFSLLEYRLIPPFAPCLVPFMFFCCPLLTAKRKKARFFSARDWCLGRQPTIPYGAVLYRVLLGETYWREPSSLAWNGSGGVFAL